MSSTFNGVDTEFIDKIHATVIQTLRPVDGEGEISRDRRLHALFNDLTCRIDPEVRRTSFKNLFTRILHLFGCMIQPKCLIDDFKTLQIKSTLNSSILSLLTQNCGSS